MFALKVENTPEFLESAKLELIKSFPKIKSSHRVEALARSMGYSTYASALTNSKIKDKSRQNINADLFCSYLDKHDFHASKTDFYLAIVRLIAEKILKENPDIGFNGYGFGPIPSYMSPTEHYNFIQEEKLICLNRDHPWYRRFLEGFLRTLCLLPHIPMTKTIRKGTGSYKLKHMAEDYSSHYPDGSPWSDRNVPTGAFIVAALHEGYTFKPNDVYGLNSRGGNFNMSRIHIEHLDRSIRTDTSFMPMKKHSALEELYKVFPYERYREYR